mmetsp:Transcript_101146/g.311891  ORF Transcript_101146/g.311891 Transcript_101146/m.311891 type:complete len:240 (+) Transcript_101146:123-842(+)
MPPLERMQSKPTKASSAQGPTAMASGAEPTAAARAAPAAPRPRSEAPKLLAPRGGPARTRRKASASGSSSARTKTKRMPLAPFPMRTRWSTYAASRTTLVRGPARSRRGGMWRARPRRPRPREPKARRGASKFARTALTESPPGVSRSAATLARSAGLSLLAGPWSTTATGSSPSSATSSKFTAVASALGGPGSSPSEGSSGSGRRCWKRPRVGQSKRPKPPRQRPPAGFAMRLLGAPT